MTQHDTATDEPMNGDNAPNCFHAIVTGKVQGVGFRVFTREAAQRAGVTGWVRNLPTGQVEVMAEGDEDALTDLLTAISSGPPWSHVSDLQIEWRQVPEVSDAFRIRK